MLFWRSRWTAVCLLALLSGLAGGVHPGALGLVDSASATPPPVRPRPPRETESGQPYFTLMTANLSGAASDCTTRLTDEAGRIFRALQPDVVAIQEFNVTHRDNHEGYVAETFGPEYEFFLECEPDCHIPNGIISRWPILDSGEWPDVEVRNRDFAWATIDLPGSRNLHVISVHFKAGDGSGDRRARIRQAQEVKRRIRAAKIPPGDFVALCGDLNLVTLFEGCLEELGKYFSDTHVPADQEGNPHTNVPRTKPYDIILANAALDAVTIDFILSGRSFPDGMVFDSRLWNPPPAPVQPFDSLGPDMQHMAVIKAFALDPDPPPQKKKTRASGRKATTTSR